MKQPNTSTDVLDARLERIESMLESIQGPARQLPDLAAIAADSFDDAMNQASAENIDVEERLKAGIQLLVRLSRPETIAGIEAAIDAMDKGPGLVSIAADSLDDVMTNADFELHTLLDTLALLALSGQEAAHMPADPVGGIFKLMSKLRDKDIAESLGFLFNFLKALGKNLKDKS